MYYLINRMCNNKNNILYYAEDKKFLFRVIINNVFLSISKTVDGPEQSGDDGKILGKFLLLTSFLFKGSIRV